MKIYSILTTLAAAITLQAAAADRITMSDVEPYVYPASVTRTPGSFKYMPDGLSYLMITDGGKKIKSYDTATGKEKAVILDVTDTRENKIDRVEGFSLSPDGSHLLVWKDYRSIYRRSGTAVYYTFNIYRNILMPLSTEHQRQMSPLFSPDNRIVAFVADNNIYLRKLDYNSEVAVTTDGKRNEIINGVPDWTYEEEFSTNISMTWSPDASMLSYLKYNETDVPEYSFSLYEGACEPMEQYALYPGIYSYKYPVAGEPNSRVSLHCYDVDTRKTKEVNFNDASIEYIPRIQYATDNALLAVTLNRNQQRMEIYSVNPRSTVVRSILVEETTSWIEPDSYEELKVEDNSFVMLSGRSGYNHLYRYSFTGQLLKTMTSGNYDVTSYYGTDSRGNYYYQSTRNGAINRTVTRVDLKGVETTVGAAEGTTSVTFAPAMNYFTMSYSSVETAPTYTLHDSKLKKLRTLEDNAEAAAKYARAPRREFIKIPTDGGLELNAYIVKPSNFSASQRYPVIMWQYGGPGSQEVLNKWAVTWECAAANAGFIVVCVDGRGTGGRGHKFQDVVYRQLGHYETIDQVNAARWIGRQPWADASRIGTSGWSYGGYMTLMCAQADESPFKAAVAVAPVTSWRYYDTVYTERYMDTPQANAEGYLMGSPVNFTSHMNSSLLIMSGTADDNVHLSNTYEYLARLQANNRLCNLMVFPNRNHSINNCNSRTLVYTNMLQHFQNNL